MITISNKQILLFLLVLNFSFGYAQEEEVYEKNNEKLFREIEFYNLRGSNVVDVAIGISQINNTYPNPETGTFFKLGLKQHINSNLNVGLSFNRYELAFDDTFKESFNSFDLNIEFIPLPYNQFTPFLYGGYGYNASTDFENTQTKMQFGLGAELIIIEGLGAEIFGEYNYVLSNEMAGLIMPDSDEGFLRVGIGLNMYFGGNKKKERLMKEVDTVINSNLIK